MVEWASFGRGGAVTWLFASQSDSHYLWDLYWADRPLAKIRNLKNQHPRTFTVTIRHTYMFTFLALPVTHIPRWSWTKLQFVLLFYFMVRTIVVFFIVNWCHVFSISELFVGDFIVQNRPLSVQQRHCLACPSTKTRCAFVRKCVRQPFSGLEFIVDGSSRWINMASLTRNMHESSLLTKISLQDPNSVFAQEAWIQYSLIHCCRWIVRTTVNNDNQLYSLNCTSVTLLKVIKLHNKNALMGGTHALYKTINSEASEAPLPLEHTHFLHSKSSVEFF